MDRAGRAGSRRRVFRFLDGREQRFQDYGAPLRQWTIRLSLLDEAELNALESFFRSHGGKAQSFAFPDPWDGTVYATAVSITISWRRSTAGRRAGWQASP